MDFYAKLIFLCKEKGVSRSKMADDIGISRSAPQAWAEKGATPRFETIKKIAEYFGVPVSYFDESTNQTIHDNHGVIGTNNGHIYNGISNENFGEIERELLEICKKLDTKRKNALLMKAYELQEEMK